MSPQTGQRVGPTGLSGGCTHDWGLAEYQVHTQSVLLSMAGMWGGKLEASFCDLLGRKYAPARASKWFPNIELSDRGAT